MAYEVLRPVIAGGEAREVGDKVELTEKDANYLLVKGYVREAIEPKPKPSKKA